MFVAISFVFTLVNFLTSASTPSLIVVITGQSVTLVCQHNRTNPKVLQWSYVPAGKNKQNFLYDKIQDVTAHGCSSSCPPDSQSCNLTLLQATPEKAGRYMCNVADRPEQNMLTMAQIEVFVGKLECSSSIRKPNTIEENNCRGDLNSILVHKCELKYFGNSVMFPSFEWLKSSEASSEIVFPSEFELKINNENSISTKFETVITTNTKSEETTCRLSNQFHFDSCVLPDKKLFFVNPRNTIEKMDMTNKHDVTCSITKSDSVNCTFVWEHQTGMNFIQIHGPMLQHEQIVSSGRYICKAVCEIEKSNTCVIETMVLLVTNNHMKAILIAMGIIIVPLVVVIIALSACVIKLRKMPRSGQANRTTSENEENNRESLISSPELLRPNVNRPEVIRPNVNRRQVENHYMNRPEVIRPNVNRLQVESYYMNSRSGRPPIDSELDHQRVIYSELDDQEVIYSEIDHQRVMYSEIDHQQVFCSELENEEVIYSELGNQEVSNSYTEAEVFEEFVNQNPGEDLLTTPMPRTSIISTEGTFASPENIAPSPSC